jgi:hypothetical protein
VIRFRLLICAAAAAACVAIPAPAHASDAVPVKLGVCDMSVAAVRDSATRLRRFVPARYRLGSSLYSLGLPIFGLSVLWTLDCDRVEVPSGPPQRAVVGIIGVQIETPERRSSIATIANMFDVYTVAAHTDSPIVGAWLREGGLPARVVPGMRMARSPRHVRIEVPDGPGRHSMRLTPLHADPIGTHSHANAFWHDDADGRAARLGLDIPHARDTACIQLLAICGVVRSGPHSPAAALLGSRRRPVDFVFDHVGLVAGALTLTRP